MTPRKVVLAGLGMLVLGWLGSFATSFVDGNSWFLALGYLVCWLLFVSGVLTVVAGVIFAIVRARGKRSTPATVWSASSSPHVPGGQPDLAAQLTQLAHLNATGALNDQEYSAAKQRAIAGN